MELGRLVYDSLVIMLSAVFAMILPIGVQRVLKIYHGWKKWLAIFALIFILLFLIIALLIFAVIFLGLE